MKDKLRKFRKHVDWHRLMLEVSDQTVLNSYWFIKLESLCKNHRLSDNRIAYLAFLTSYPKKYLDYYRYTGDQSVFSRNIFNPIYRTIDSVLDEEKTAKEILNETDYL